MKSNYTEKKDTYSPIEVKYIKKPGKEGGVAVQMEVDKDKVFALPDFKTICDTIVSQNLSHAIAAWVHENGRMPEGFDDADAMVKEGIKLAKRDIEECVHEALVKYLALHVLDKASMHENFRRAKNVMMHIIDLQHKGE